MEPFIRADPTAGTLSIDAGKMAIRSVITTDRPDCSRDVVIPTGLKNADEFLLNPVVLWGHNRSAVPPIGTCAWLDIQPHRVVAETRFAQGVPFAEDVFRLYEQGILKGWSIGFLPRKAARCPHPGGIGLRFDEWELLEYSAVPTPDNPGAVTLAIQKGYVHDPYLRDWLSRVPDDRGGRWWPVRMPDVLSRLVA